MNHPDLETLLKGVGEGGWADLDNLEAKAAEQAKASREAALLKAQTFEACFGTRAGKEVLEWLLSMTIYRPPAWRGNTFESLDKITGYGLFREGQNSIAWTILEALAVARGEQPRVDNLGGE